MTFSVHTAYRKLTRGDFGDIGLRALCCEKLEALGMQSAMTGSLTLSEYPRDLVQLSCEKRGHKNRDRLPRVRRSLSQTVCRRQHPTTPAFILCDSRLDNRILWKR